MHRWIIPTGVLVLCGVCALWAWALVDLQHGLHNRQQLRWEDIAPDPQATPRVWRSIVLHHSDSQRGDAASFDRHHLTERGWDGIGYHFVIGNGHGMQLGAIEATFRWYRQAAGAHAGVREANEHGIGICLVGDFSQEAPPSLQWERSAELCALLLLHTPELDLQSIVGHRDVRATDCPGASFDLPAFRAAVARHLAQLRSAQP